MKNAMLIDAVDLPPAGNLGKIHAVCHDPNEAGSCNFCSVKSRKVLVIQGQRTEIRMCPRCLDSIYRQSAN